MIETREEIERPGALRRAVAELGALAAAPEAGRHPPAGRLEALSGLGSPSVLDLLFRLALVVAVRRGPAAVSESGSPAALLELAGAAAAGGLVPVSTVAELRREVGRLEEALRGSGAWDPAHSYWWSPLPPPGPLEELRRELGQGSISRGGLRLPPGEEIRTALADAGQPPSPRPAPGPSPPPSPSPPWGWISWRRALPEELLRRVATELQAAERELLGLQPGGVGQSARRSGRRTDAVRFLTGLEPGLVERAPRLAVLVQNLLETVEEPLRSALPGRSLFAPQTVMLARYPAPSDGYAAHLDNPGGPDDNRRALTLVLYLNPPDAPCRGGALAVWAPGFSPEAEPVARVPAEGGSAVLFDAGAVPHAVEPLAPGPDRWTLVLWLSGRLRRPARPLLPVPGLTPDQALLPLEDPPLAPGALILRRVGRGGGGSVGSPPLTSVLSPPSRGGKGRPLPTAARVGVVATVHRDLGAGAALTAWCRHHLALGVERLLLVLDGADESEAQPVAVRLARSLAEDLEERGSERLTVWSEAEARLRWEGLPATEELDSLRRHAHGGTAAWAVAARQTLNASAALEEARGSLDWLLHLDGDELFYLEGAGRGGATLAEHFAAVEAEGWTVVRYVNHELMVPPVSGGGLAAAPRFKRNPALAAARLGPEGWARLARLLAMEQGDRRPWFRAYWNGKSAVAVSAGLGARGVHGWAVAGGAEGAGPGPEEPLLAGPSILHFHLPTAAAFRRKYLAVAGAPDDPGRPFPPSPLERAACDLIRGLRRAGAPAGEIGARLDELYEATTAFSPGEVDLLEEAGLLFTPRLEHWPVPSDERREGAPEAAGRRGRAGERHGAGAAPWLQGLDQEAERRRLEAAERAPHRTLPGRGSRIGAREGPREPPLSVGVLGGGTAGYLAALALRTKRPEIRVTLIESRDLPILGVGEATTPLMPQFLHADLRVGAGELFREVRPTLKLGVRLLWGSPESSGDGAFPYPFGPLRPLEAVTWDGHLEACSLQAALMAAGALPVEEGPGGAGGPLRVSFGTEVAYHLDNRRLAGFLKRLAVERGVEVVDARIVRVETGAGDRGEPEVTALAAEDGRRFSFDLYLDCSGFRSLLVGEALGSPFVGYGRSLFTDRALVGAVPGDGRLPPYTEARTMAAGWCWSIPQEGEDHVGYVYSSAFAGAEEAAAELRRSLPKGAEGFGGGADLRELSFRPGRRRHFWKGNAVALGNAYGFVEPLEATALHLLIRQIGLLLRALPVRSGEAALAPLVNARAAAFWDYVAWFLALHFRFNRRLETPFWRSCREEADVSAHGELLELFRERGPLSYDPAARSLFDYPDPLWGPEGIDTILLGQGVEARLPRPAVSREAWRERAATYRRVAGRSVRQEEVLRRLGELPEVLEELEAGFRRRGPAFS